MADDDEQPSAWNWGSFGAAALGVIHIFAGVFLQGRTTGITAVLLIRQGSLDIMFAGKGPKLSGPYFSICFHSSFTYGKNSPTDKSTLSVMSML